MTTSDFLRDSNDIPGLPLTFKEKLEARRIEAAANKAVPSGPVLAKPLPTKTTGRNREDDIVTLYALLEEEKLTSWEVAFCNSVVKQLLRIHESSNEQLSTKQAAVVDKLDRLYLEPLSGGDPTPKGNPPAQFATPQMKMSASFKNMKGHHDDEDDDIPF